MTILMIVSFLKKRWKICSFPLNLTIVHDGEQLMNYLSMNSNNLPDILFLDLSMPRKNGLECLSEIKQDKKLKDLSLVMLSTSNSKDTINHGLQASELMFIFINQVILHNSNRLFTMHFQ